MEIIDITHGFISEIKLCPEIILYLVANTTKSSRLCSPPPNLLSIDNTFVIILFSTSLIALQSNSSSTYGILDLRKLSIIDLIVVLVMILIIYIDH